MKIVFPKGVCRLIEETRKKKGISMSKLASLADVTPAYISQIESCQACPSIEVLVRIGNALSMELHISYERARNANPSN